MGTLYHAAIQTTENGQPIQAASNPISVYNENHMLVVNDYDHVLHDYLKRNFSLGVKVNSVKSSGYPHTWNEQKAIPVNTTAVDPQIGFGTKDAPSYRPKTLVDDYKRDNWKHAFARCYTTGIRYTYFTRQMENNYGTFENLTEKDYSDMFVDFAKTTCDDFWNGTTALDATDTFKYCGVISQISANKDNVTAIADGTKIADALNTKIANLMARLDYAGYPDVIAMNPATYDILIKEEAERSLYQREITTEIVPGVSVPAFFTPMGKLPIVLTPFIKPVVSTEAGTTKHQIVAVNSAMIDRIWMFSEKPQIFEIANPEMPFANEALLTDKFMLDFANYIVHGVDTGMHFILEKTVKN